MYVHKPVLLNEVLGLLAVQPGEHAVDATLGGGGYTKALLGHVGSSGKLLAIDLDEAAITAFSEWTRAQQAPVVTSHGNFKNIDQIVVAHGFTDVAAIVADIGLSSYHLDESGRGVSFQKHEPLDMRFDVRGDTATAAFILNHHDEAELRKLFRDYGEERYASQIAHAIIRARAEHPIRYTTELVDLIKTALPAPVKHRWADSARRIFQALRIAVNHELDNLQGFLPNAFNILAPGGRLAVVTFHSLEDRIVKQYFVSLAKGCVCPPDFPQCRCGRNPQGKILTKKPIQPSEAELEENPRSRSAKLRAIQKIAP